MSTIPLNGKPPLGYRITTTDREIGAPTDAPEDFIVLNRTNDAAFKSTDGEWVDATGTFDADLLDAWNATIPGVIAGSYRVTTTDREDGAPTEAPEDFIVINSTNNSVFQVQSGEWVDVTSGFDAGTLSDLLDAWNAA